MKRGKKLLTYLFSMAFCLFAVMLFDNGLVSAAHEYVCIDNENNDVCSEQTTDAYLILKKYEVSATDTTLVFENEATYNGKTYPVKEIGYQGEPVIVFANGEKLNLTSLTLPSNLFTLNSNALKNISTVTESIILPNKLFFVGANIFDDGANIASITLNHYLVEYIDDIGIPQNEPIEYHDDAFSNANLGKIICGSEFVYDNVTSNNVLYKETITAILRYYFYSSKAASENPSATPVDERVYYVGETITEVPTINDVRGLVELGWTHELIATNEYDSLLSVGDTPIYNKTYTEYKMYPIFELEKLNFVINSNATDKVYNAQENLIVLTIDEVDHLLNEDGFITKIKWTKNGYDLVEGVETLSFANASDTGLYTCQIFYEHTYEGITYYGDTTVSQYIKIRQSVLYIEVLDAETVYGTYLKDSDLSFKHNGLLGIDNIPEDGYLYTYHNEGNLSAGVYKNEIKISIQKIEGLNSENVIDNYDIKYVYGDHTILKKNLGKIGYEGTITTIYGEEKEIFKEVDDQNVYGTITNKVKIVFARRNGNTVNTYPITGIESIDNSNYTAEFDNTLAGQYIIEKKPVTISYFPLTNTYNGQPKDITIYYESYEGIKVSVPARFIKDDIEVEEVINAGKYFVVVDEAENENYTITNKIGLNFYVDKAKPKINFPTSIQEFTYTGEPIYPVVSVDNDEQVSKTYCTNSLGEVFEYCLDVGIYSVEVKFLESENYLPDTTANIQPMRLTIAKHELNLNPHEFKLYYGEKPVMEERIFIKGEELVIKYDAGLTSTSEVAAYNIGSAYVYEADGITRHKNYSARVVGGTAKAVVVARPVTIHYYGFSGLVYDGEEKQIGVYLIDSINGSLIKDIKPEMTFDQKSIKNAGKYTVHSTLENVKYTITNSTILEFEIAKGTYDLSHIKFNSKKYVLDFKSHSISIEGVLPNGVGVEYTIDGEKGNSSSSFSHTVVASFIVDLNNYNPIESMEATIDIDMSWLIIVIISVIVAAGIGLCAALLYMSYRREHPRKIKLKIKNVIHEDLAAKRVATSVKEVLGDELKKEEVEEVVITEDENDLPDDKVNNQSFIERIYAASSELKYYYSEVKNELLSYEGISHSVDRKYEVFYHGTRPVAKLSICNGILRLYVNLDPMKYDKRQYNHKDMSKFTCHEKTPLRINVNSLETLRHAKVFIRIIRKKEKLEAVSGFARIDYEKFYTLKEKFIPNIFKNVFNKNNKKKSKK